jgi:hypothetical protein
MVLAGQQGQAQPATYIRTAALLVAASYLLAFVALYESSSITLAVGLAGCTNLVSPIMSMGLLGEEEVEVFEVSVTHMCFLCNTRHMLYVPNVP